MIDCSAGHTIWFGLAKVLPIKTEREDTARREVPSESFIILLVL
jgi:hypothetical protein